MEQQEAAQTLKLLEHASPKRSPGERVAQPSLLTTFAEKLKLGSGDGKSEKKRGASQQTSEETSKEELAKELQEVLPSREMAQTAGVPHRRKYLAANPSSLRAALTVGHLGSPLLSQDHHSEVAALLPQTVALQALRRISLVSHLSPLTLITSPPAALPSLPSLATRPSPSLPSHTALLASSSTPASTSSETLAAESTTSLGELWRTSRRSRSLSWARCRRM